VWNIPYTTAGFAPAPVNGDLAKLSEAEAHTVAAEASARAEEVGVETRTLVLRGFPVEEICRAAETYKPCFLVVGSHGWGAMKRALFGSVSTGVLHRAKCPVLVVRSDEIEAAQAANGTRQHARA
jgi:nucleotide-binding universal stress UspA family protein